MIDIHIAIDSLSLNADRSSQQLQSRRAALCFGQCSRLLNYSINPRVKPDPISKIPVIMVPIGRYLQDVSIALRDQLIKSIISQFEE